MAAGICHVIIRMPWGTEYEVGSVELHQGDSHAALWTSVLDLVKLIASEVEEGCYDTPAPPEEAWLNRVDLREFTDSIPRERSPYAEPGNCGAWPARAFRPRYLVGCVAAEGHDGTHYTDMAAYLRARRRADKIAQCDLKSPCRCMSCPVSTSIISTNSA